MITVEQAKELKYGQTLYSNSRVSSDGWPERWRVTSKVKTWKTMPDRVEFSVMYGLYCTYVLDEHDLKWYCLDEDEAMAEIRRKM